MIERRTLLKGLAAAVALPALAGCSGRKDGPAAGGGGEDLRDAILYRLKTPRSIDPFDADAAGLAVASQLFDPLMRYDFDTSELVCHVAESVEMNEDATALTFHLRHDLTFSNGDAVDAASFKRAWERLVDPDSAAARLYEGSPWAYLLTLVEGYDALSKGTANELAGLTCPDEATLRVQLSKSYADFPLLCAHPALSPVPASAVEDAEAFHVCPIGNGAFSLVNAWDGKEALTFKRVEGYVDPISTGAVPESDGSSGAVASEPIASARFIFDDDSSSAYKRLEAGDIDVSEVPVEQLEGAEDAFGPKTDGLALESGSHLLSTPEPTVVFLTCNMTESPFDNADVRRALSLAIDREALCDKVYRGAAAPATSAVPPCIATDGDVSWSYASYDPERAKQFLELHYPADEDGTRKLEVTIVCSKDGADAKLMDAVAADLKAVGVSLKTEAVDWDELVSRFRTGDFACGLTSWTPDAPSLDSALYPLFRSGVAAAGNYAHYADVEVDAALDRARTTVDTAARRQALSRALRIAGEASPIIPLAVPVRTVATSDRVTSLAIDSYGRPDLASATF